MNLDINEINILLEEIFFFQSKSYINSSSHNILIFNKNTLELLRDFMEAKMVLVDGIIKMYYNEKITNTLIFSAYKIFLVKSAIIKELDNKEIINMYDVIKNLNDYKEIIDEIKDNKLKEKLHSIYTQ